jgi:hypothetical protein
MQGSSLSLSGDGETLAMGAPSDIRSTNDIGRVRVLRYDTDLGWLQLGDAFYGENIGDRLVICKLLSSLRLLTVVLAGHVGVDIGRWHNGGDERRQQR